MDADWNANGQPTWKRVNEVLSLDKISPRHEQNSKLAYRINVILIANFMTNKKKRKPQGF
jgi:hypothetical protein